MEKATVMGIDLAKEVFQVHGVDREGLCVLRKKIRRSELKVFMAQLPSCLVGMEACGSSHYWAREFEKLGHEVKLMAAQFVRPYVKSNKNDQADAEAICEAVRRPNMRFVPANSLEQQDMQSLHRVRHRLVKQRTALTNQIRGLLQEYGIIVPQKLFRLRRAVPEILGEGENGLTPVARELVSELLEELRGLEERILLSDRKIQAVFKQNEVCQRVGQIPGVGVLTATAMVSALGNGRAFKNGRQVAAWLGLVPKQHSSGGKERLLGMSKRGDPYLRMLLIHGARAVLHRLGDKQDRRSQWLRAVQGRRGLHKAYGALANKNARTIWALIVKGEEYRVAA